MTTHVTRALRVLAPNDLRLIWRDSFLLLILLVTPVFCLALRWLAPYLTGLVAEWVELERYYGLILANFVIGGQPVLLGAVIGILFIEERDEGTLDVVLVSPLRPAEYLASKLLTVTALALVESALIVGIVYGLGFSFPWLGLAVLLRAGLVAAVGVAVGVRYRSITRFLMPMVVLSVAFDLPVLWYLELWPSPLFYLWPTLPSLLLAKAAFLPVDPLELVYACVYGALAVAAAVFWASRAFDRFVVRGELDS